VLALLSSLRIQVVTDLVARRAGEMLRDSRHSHPGITLADCLVAATAETLGARLATWDARRFPMLTGLDEPLVVPRA